MFNIYPTSGNPLNRKGTWDAPAHWRDTPSRPRSEFSTERERRAELRRWLRQTGIM